MSILLCKQVLMFFDALDGKLKHKKILRIRNPLTGVLLNTVLRARILRLFFPMA